MNDAMLFQSLPVEQLQYLFLLLVLLLFVELFLKGLGLWRAAKMNKPGWFIAMLVINSAGILPGIFLLITRGEYERKK
jgi:Family of unknown function (DUF5652)